MYTESQHAHVAAEPAPRQVVHIGGDGALMAAALEPLGAGITLRTETEVARVLVAVAQGRTHAVIIDLTVPDDARTLLIAALANSKHPPRIILIARRDKVSALLRLPGVYCVIAYPLLPAQIRAAVADRRGKRRNNEPPREPPVAAGPAPASDAPSATEKQEPPAADFKAPQVAEAQAAWPGFRLYMLGANRFMSIISTLYKNAAFALLASLFTAFCFYGLLIGYFLLASGWGAPVTLSRGQELVEKTVSTIADLEVSLSVNDQRRSEAELDARKAESAFNDATLMVQFMKAMIESEIASRTEQAKITKDANARARKVLHDFSGQGQAGDGASPQQLYDKRLITKKQFQQAMAGSLEASARIADLQTKADAAESESARSSGSIEALKSLRKQLDGVVVTDIASGGADLLQFAKQAVDARSGLDQAEKLLASAKERARLLASNDQVIRQRIAELRASAAGRAIGGRVDVIFVPYGNEASFKPGTALYACALTVIVCHRSGVVGKILPGEATTVHPFFGKPMRGFFVEAELSDPAAATKEIIHAGRPPFFF